MKIARIFQSTMAVVFLSFAMSNAQAASFLSSPILLPTLPDLLLEIEKAIHDVVKDNFSINLVDSGATPLAARQWCVSITIITCTA